MFSFGKQDSINKPAGTAPAFSFGASANTTAALNKTNEPFKAEQTNTSGSTASRGNTVIMSQPTPYSTQIADSLTSLQEQILPISPSCKFQQLIFNINEQLSTMVIQKPVTKNIEEWQLILNKTPVNMIPVTLNNLEDEYSRLKLQQTTIIAFRTTINKLYYDLYLPTNEKMIAMKPQIEDMILKIDKLQTKLYKIELKLRYLITSSNNQQENYQHTANSLAIDLKIEQLNTTIQESSNKLISGDCWNKLSLLKKKHQQLQKISENFNLERENSAAGADSSAVDESVLKILQLQQDGIVYLDKIVSKDLQESF